MLKPSIPKGTRDFSPEVMIKRNFIFDTIRNVFRKYGYLPIETPAIENLSTLTGKYGEEGDRLIFKILNSGNYFSSFENDNDVIETKNKGGNGFTTKIAEKALRYDLTVPFARYVVQHQNEITFPFKRYQIQPVWRADRPQKGRYREFYQCDVDVIGSDSLLNEVEMIQIMDDVFSALQIPVTIKINNRKILSGIAEELGATDKLIDLTVAIDKLDKIGSEQVKAELIDKGFSEEQVNKLMSIIFLEAGRLEIIPDKEMDKKHVNISVSLKTIELYNNLFTNSNTLKQGLDEMSKILAVFYNTPLLQKADLIFTPSLARGLNYYTGTIFEVTTKDFPSSICGGGRYDDLTGIFGLPHVSGVGISFGADRIYDVMEEKNLFSTTITTHTQILFINFGEQEAGFCLPVLQQLRQKGICAELYPDAAKLKKQMKYADAKGIKYVAFAGKEEIENKGIKIKNMLTGDEQTVAFEEETTLLQSIFKVIE